MPNRNSNCVTIGAPLSELKRYLVKNDKGKLMFNMHALYPTTFSSDDPTWEKGWDYDQTALLTGSKWYPYISSVVEKNNQTILTYDTARVPNNELLIRLHQFTGWTIKNEFEEPGDAFEWELECEDGDCQLEKRAYHPMCVICEIKFHHETIQQDDYGERVCNNCMKLN